MKSVPYCALLLRALRAGCAALASLCGVWASHAAPLTFQQIPPASSWREPAPNIILSIDDSGSMGLDLDGCGTIDWIFAYPGFYNALPTWLGCDGYTPSQKSSRIAQLRSVLLRVFGDAQAQPPTTGMVPDGRVRLAWQAMHDNGESIPGAGARALVPGAINTLRPLEGAHRRQFSKFVHGLAPRRATASHLMLQNAYQYLRSPQGLHSPWADHPGVAQSSPYLACRRSYHIFFTDGSWDPPGSREVPALAAAHPGGDGTARTLGDGRHQYDITSPQTLPYRDRFGENGLPPTLSDMAFHAWASDLQDGSGNTANMPNQVAPLMRRPQKETFCSGDDGARCTTLDPFWNPRNDPATWQHLSLYTIGFGKEATEWSGKGNQLPVWDPLRNDTFGGEFAGLLTGERQWADVISQRRWRPSELWHMALNGRGKFFPAHDQQALEEAFREILDTIRVHGAPKVASVATDSAEWESVTHQFQAGYQGERFAGALLGFALQANAEEQAQGPQWDAAALLDGADPSQRFVASADKHLGFDWSHGYDQLPQSQRAALERGPQGQTDGLGPTRWRYLRGWRDAEQSRGGALRDRDSRLGSIVNANLWHIAGRAGTATGTSSPAAAPPARPAMVYAGANDGMLHGFDAATGRERLAYIPAGIASGPLRELTYPGHLHRYMVDGSLLGGDILSGDAPHPMSVLVGTLGAGGKGYFVLNVDDPARFNPQHVSGLVLRDTTNDTQDPDLGHIFAGPALDDSYAQPARQITRLNNGRWAVLLGNGYNSTNEAPVLLIQHLDGDRSRLQLSPCTQPIRDRGCDFKVGNGLSTPRPVDLDGNGTADVVYAGDLRGHFWKFDLSSKDTRKWHTAFDGKPFFSTPLEGGVPEPITSAPLWQAHPRGGGMLAFGTGQLLTPADQTLTRPGTLYALHDDSTYTMAAGETKLHGGRPINTPDTRHRPQSLVRQTASATPVAGIGTTGFAAHHQAATYPAHRGWYMPLPLQGQRVLRPPRRLGGQKVLFLSTVPAGNRADSAQQEQCAPPQAQPGRNFVTVLNLLSGAAPTVSAFEWPSPLVEDSLLRRPPVVTTLELPSGSDAWLRGKDTLQQIAPNCTEGAACQPFTLRTGHYTGLRAGWHQLQ